MSYWMEIRCISMESNKCYSSRQVDTPMKRTYDASKAAVMTTVLLLTREAIKLGWKFTKDGWICPECKDIKDE